MKKFSVLMPIGPNFDHNVLQKAWNSILKQSLIPNEIVIILDGLKEFQKLRVLKIIKNYKNLKYFDIPKQECLADVLNYGLSKCKYQYVARVDADDINYKERFMTQINKISKEKIDIIGSSMKFIIGKKVKIRNKSSFSNLYKFINPLNHPTIILDRIKILSIGGYPRLERFEDYSLWFKSVKNNFKIVNLAKPLVYTYVDNNYFERRSGWKYFKYEIKFQIYIYKENHINFFIFIFNLFTRSFISLFGNLLKPIIFKHIY